MTIDSQLSIERVLRERLRKASQTAKRAKTYETRLRAQGRVKAYRDESRDCAAHGGVKVFLTDRR